MAYYLSQLILIQQQLVQEKSGKFAYGLTSTLRKQEPLTEMNVDASIRPKEVYRAPIIAPTVNITAPRFQALNVPNLLPSFIGYKDTRCSGST